MSTETINVDRKPTPADMRILEWLQSGNSINNLQAIQQFQNAMLRDAIWRLKKAGYPIQSEWKNYETKAGTKKKFKIYFITKPEILPSGYKTENKERAMKKEGSVVDVSKKINAVQLDVFKNVQNGTLQPHG